MAASIKALKAIYPWIKTPLIISAPMRVFSGPLLATAVSLAGGIGFLGPGKSPSDLEPALAETQDLLLPHMHSPHSPFASSLSPLHHDTPTTTTLPIGVGFQLFDANLSVATAAVSKYRPRAVWLFAPHEKDANDTGTHDLARWTRALRAASSTTQIWIQVGTVQDAVAIATEMGDGAHPDVLVLQGSDAGGHGLARGAGIVSLVPEVRDALERRGVEVPLMAAGGIADGRGVAGALALGAVGAVMGTRFLVAEETAGRVAQGYRDEILRAWDGGRMTVRTRVFDALAGRVEWPGRYDGRSVVNRSVEDDEAGVPIQDNRRMFEEALKIGDQGWGPDGRMTTYAGTAVGLVREVAVAERIIRESREMALECLDRAVRMV